ncbi:peroxisome biogenesis factor 1 [Copidosoma floridanum]|uniref:peroxisome biogenesis factor 1 n=1 Tax=Copidosoma floridanum TaxID=29053 RepID=UPI000C6FC921|nr:peroxisome biogenesis factor 1 [Copidosoma floridanum]
MIDERFTVKYISVSTCFVYLPEHRLRRLYSRESSAVCVRHNEFTYYLSWCSAPGPDSESLCIGATFAQSLGIREGDELLVTSIDEAPALTSLVVVPKSAQDRVVLELQSDNVQSRLLDQIRVVAKNQPIVAWTSRYNHVTVIVDSMSPEFKYGRLENLTEVHVEGEATSPRQTAALHPLDVIGSLPTPLRLPSDTSRRVYRVHPLPDELFGTLDSQSALDELSRSPFCVHVRKELLPPETAVDSPDLLYRIKKVKEDRLHAKTQGVKLDRRANAEQELVVKVRVAEHALARLRGSCEGIERYFTVFEGSFDNVNARRDLMDNLLLKTGGRVKLEPVNEGERSDCTGIEVYPLDRPITAEEFVDYVKRNSKYGEMLLNSQATIALEDGTRCLVKLLPEDGCSYGFFDGRVLGRIEVRVSDAASIEESRPLEQPAGEEGAAATTVASEILEPVIREATCALRLSLGLHGIRGFDYGRDNALVSGATGSGKTTSCKLLGKLLSEPPYFAHVRFVDCKSLKGKKAEVVQKFLTAEVSQAVYHQPSVIFFDDVDSITSVSSSTDENTPDAINAARITDAIHGVISECQRENYVSIVATCTDVKKIGQKLREARGVHFFCTMLTIPPLEKAERMEILRSSLEDKLQLARTIDWEHYGNKTEGWVAQDLIVLADKGAFGAWKRHVKERSEGRSPMLLSTDLEDALTRCSPLSLRGVDLYRGEGHTWSDIGGLADVKLTLVEILHWPIRYPNIFKAAPIKLQSGVLLYGMPGTGKTMLAGAIAKECGLNLISVKGPELLSKYVGASEEAVRNVFEKAHRAKPCVLFFDEFDSLAPRRGQDSTGVTDRVVNQLLTHLDGIEGREGVAVVAASSRPDLLDPALLRPGRLDKALLCPLPDENDRNEILHSLSRTHGVDSSELDLEAIARMTAGFTGADLNAILVQARLDVIEEAMESTSVETKERYAEAKVTQSHLLRAAESSMPSLLTAEKQKYNRIYEKFARSESSVVDEMKHQKATLA